MLNHVVLSFGRFNPPTSGHAKLIEKVLAVAKTKGAQPRIYLSHTKNAKKDPLSYEQKVHFLRYVYGLAIHVSYAANIIKILKEMSKEHITRITLVVGSDRVQEFKELLEKYNHHEFEFAWWDVVSAGERDPDAEGVEGMSASKLRALAVAGKQKDFINGALPGLPIPGKIEMYNDVRKAMGIKEEHDLDESVYRSVHVKYHVNAPKGSEYSVKATTKKGRVKTVHVGGSWNIAVHKAKEHAKKHQLTGIKSVLGTTSYWGTKEHVANQKKNQVEEMNLEEYLDLLESVEVEEVDDLEDSAEFTDAELDEVLEMDNEPSIDDVPFLETLIPDAELSGSDEEETVTEARALTILQRVKLGQRMRRMEPRLERQRELKKKRMATPGRLKYRARKAGINALRKRVAGNRGMDYGKLSAGQKVSIDRQVKARFGKNFDKIVGGLAARMTPKIRKKEMARLKQARSTAVESVVLEAKQKTGNPGYGYHGEYSKGGGSYDPEFPNAANHNYHLMHGMVKQVAGEAGHLADVKKPNHMVRHYLDSVHGRHLAGNEEPEYIKKDFGKFKKTYDPKHFGESEAIHEARHGKASVAAGEQGDAGDTNIIYQMRKVINLRGQYVVKFNNGDTMKMSPDTASRINNAYANKLEKPAQKHHFVFNAIKNKALFKMMAERDLGVKITEETIPLDNQLDALFENDAPVSQGTRKVSDIRERRIVEKAEDKDIPHEILEEVYQRGCEAWELDEETTLTQQEYAFNRVNSFAAGGAAHEMDADLLEGIKEEVEVTEGKRSSAFDRMYKALGKKPPFKKPVPVKEEGGAGDEGSDKLRKTYSRETPGQTEEIQQAAQYMPALPWEVQETSPGKSVPTYLKVREALRGK